MPTETAQAYINWGRWVIDCPHCGGGILAPPGKKSPVECPDCGGKVTPKHPHANTIKAAEDVLSKRPDIANHNWRPGTEELADLKVDNLVRGLAP